MIWWRKRALSARNNPALAPRSIAAAVSVPLPAGASFVRLGLVLPLPSILLTDKQTTSTRAGVPVSSTWSAARCTASRPWVGLSRARSPNQPTTARDASRSNCRATSRATSPGESGYLAVTRGTRRRRGAPAKNEKAAGQHRRASSEARRGSRRFRVRAALPVVWSQATPLVDDGLCSSRSNPESSVVPVSL